MPCQTRRVVVLTEQAYDRLLAASTKPLDVAETATQVDAGEQEEVLTKQQDRQSKSPSPSPKTPEGENLPKPSESAIGSSSSKRPELETIPDRFLPCAEKLLTAFDAMPHVTWKSPVGQMYISGICQPISVCDLIKAASVPFTRASVPLECKRIVQESGIHPRNHLFCAPVLKPWHPYFSI